MRILHLIPFVALLTGCSTTAPRTSSLTPDTAGSLAQRLANEKAQAAYDFQPFRKAEPAKFIGDHWTWHQIRGRGKGDMEAKIEFRADGSDPRVSVTRLESLYLQETINP